MNRMNFAEENLRPVSAYLTEQANGIGVEFEPFEMVVDGEANEQEEPEINLNSFQLPTSDLTQLANKTFPAESISERCEGSIYLEIQLMGEHFWVDLLKLEFGQLHGDRLEAKIHVRFTDLYFTDPSSFEHTIATILQRLPE